MKAAVYHGPGDVRIEDVREPGPPGQGEVVLQVRMGSLCGTDASQYKAATMVPLDSPHRISGHSGPVILGHEVVGVVVARGSGVTHLEIGQRVVPGAGWWCGVCPRCKEGRINICENYYLVIEMPVKRAFGQTDLARDLLGRHTCQSLQEDQLFSGIQDLLLCFSRHLLPCQFVCDCSLTYVSIVGLEILVKRKA